MLLYKEFPDMSIGFVGEFPLVWDLFRSWAEGDENQELCCCEIVDSMCNLIKVYRQHRNLQPAPPNPLSLDLMNYR